MNFKLEAVVVADIVFQRLNALASPDEPKILKGEEVQTYDWRIMWENQGVRFDRLNNRELEILGNDSQVAHVVNMRQKVVQTLLADVPDIESMVSYMESSLLRVTPGVLEIPNSNPAFTLFENTLAVASGAISPQKFADRTNLLVCQGLVSDPSLLNDAERAHVMRVFGYDELVLRGVPVINPEGMTWFPKLLANDIQ